MNIKYISILLAFTFTITVNTTNAQKKDTKLKQEVEVTKAYKPTVSDAFKINDIPQIKEDKTEKPIFEYSIYSEPVFSTFSVKPVQAATITGTSRTKLEKGLIKAGIGNYKTPYGEFFYNTCPSRKSNFGMHFRHLSSHGKIKLLNNDKVKAPTSDNEVELFGKYFFRRSTLTTTGFFNRKGLQYYGYIGDQLSNEEKEAYIPTWQDKQAFSKGGINLNLKTNSDTRSDIAYDLGLYYHYFGTKTDQNENLVKLDINLSKNFDSFRGVLESEVKFYQAEGITNRFATNTTQRQQILVMINPAVVFATETSFLQAGVKTYTMFDNDTSATLNIMPNLKAEWSPVENILTLYAHAGGYLDHNVYSKITEENPFADQRHDIRDTKYQYIVSGGIKGKFSAKTNFFIETSYAGIKDMHFFTISGTDYNNPSSTTVLNNTFGVVYDDLNLLKFSGEIFHAASENLSFRLNGNYYSYNLKNQEKAWHMPDFDLNLSFDYKTGPFEFSLAAFAIGERKALFTNNQTTIASQGYSNIVYSMDPIFDLNASVNYQYADNLSFFLHLNNLAFQHYEKWIGYRNQSFNALAGISFSF